MSKNSVKIAPGAVVCNECELRGDISIGSMTVIHPRATIIAEAGPIIIGENNLIEEQSVIINRMPPGEPPTSTPVLIIGANNVFEVDCHSEALKIGDNNILESKSYLGREVELTNGCIIGAGCKLTHSEVVPENTVIFGGQCTRRQQADKPPVIDVFIPKRIFYKFIMLGMSPNLAIVTYPVLIFLWPFFESSYTHFQLYFSSCPTLTPGMQNPPPASSTRPVH